MKEKASQKRSEIAKLICDIRTKGTKNNESAQKLLCLLTGENDWINTQCQCFYESLLHHYIHDDATLEMLRCVSGLADGYQIIPTATKRREMYLEYLKKREDKCIYLNSDPENLRKKEDELLESVAKQLEEDIASGKAHKLLVEWGMIESQEATDPQSSGQKDADGSPTTAIYTNISQSDENHHNTSSQDTHYHFHIQPTQMDTEKKNITSGKGSSMPSSSHQPPSKNNHRNPIIIGVVVVLLAGAVFLWSLTHTAPKQMIDDPTEKIALSPGEIYSVKPITSTNVDTIIVEYISSDPDIIEVSPDGLIAVRGGTEAIGSSVEIAIKGEGIYQKKTVTIVNGSDEFPPVDLEHFEPDYTVQTKVRVAGTTEWATSVAAEIGDEVEFQAQVRNTGDMVLENIVIKDILPTNLAYIPQTTKIYNVEYDGAALNDGISTSGLILGNYTLDSNVYVRFSAKVVDVNLVPGSNTLVNWAQAGVGQITLSDYAAVEVQK